MQRVREQVQVPEQLYDGQSNTSPAVIAVLDTGIAYHPDLAGKLLCFADFVEKRQFPNDENGPGTHI